MAGWLAVGLSAAQAQYSYTTNGSTYYYKITNSAITITNFSGSGDVTIPGVISNMSVTTLGSNAVANGFLTGVTVPDSVTNIVGSAFCILLLRTDEHVTFPANLAIIGPLAFD